MDEKTIIRTIQSNMPPQNHLPTKDFVDTILADMSLVKLVPQKFNIEVRPIDRVVPPQDLWLYKQEALETGYSIGIHEVQTLKQIPDPPGVVDTLAYYLPFHFYTNWGIYIKSSGISLLAEWISFKAGIPIKIASDLAFCLLRTHEIFHYKTEIACARAECLSDEALYRHYYNSQSAAFLEELMASSFSYIGSLKGFPRSVREVVKEWYLSQPPGYRDFQACLEPAKFKEACNLLAGHMKLAGYAVAIERKQFTIKGITISPNELKISEIDSLLPAGFLFTGIGSRVPPVYLVMDDPSVALVKKFPKYNGLHVRVYTNDHPPPHIHVIDLGSWNELRLTWPDLKPLSKEDTPASSVVKRLKLYLD